MLLLFEGAIISYEAAVFNDSQLKEKVNKSENALEKDLLMS